MANPKFKTFHNPLKHAVLDHTSLKPSGQEVSGVRLKFEIPTAAGEPYAYDLAPGEEMQIEEHLAYAVKIYAPQMAEGPAPKAAPLEAEPDADKGKSDGKTKK
jgi:hypothetical protein